MNTLHVYRAFVQEVNTDGDAIDNGEFHVMASDDFSFDLSRGFTNIVSLNNFIKKMGTILKAVESDKFDTYPDPTGYENYFGAADPREYE